jgi:hypothetical protein
MDDNKDDIKSKKFQCLILDYEQRILHGFGTVMDVRSVAMVNEIEQSECNVAAKGAILQ